MAKKKKEPIRIELKTPFPSKQLHTLLKTLPDVLDTSFTVEQLKNIWVTFTGTAPEPTKKKADLSALVASLLSFETAEDWAAFFSRLPDYLLDMMYEGAFYDSLLISRFEKKHGIMLLAKRKSSYYYAPVLNDDVRIHCFVLDSHDSVRLAMPFKILFNLLLEPPAAVQYTPIQEEPFPVWTNSELRSENIALALENIPPFNVYTRGERVRGSLKKAELNALRSRIGIDFLLLSGKKGPDPVALLDRFVCAFYADKPQRPKDVDEWIKDAVSRFFLDIKLIQKYERTPDPLTGASFEHYALCEHLSCEPGNRLRNEFHEPLSRQTFRSLLLSIAEKPEWYDIESLVLSLEIRNFERSYWPLRIESAYVYYKAVELRMPEFRVVTTYSDRLSVAGPVRRYTVHYPLFRAYFYLMAVFGLVEISERENPVKTVKTQKERPVSNYDTVFAVRVTPFGRWCLGLDSEKPANEKRTFEAIADRELLMVTFRGKSLERKLYLEAIGEAVGEERYRITASSFSHGCVTMSDIDRRIESFQRLIEPDPSPKWKTFFSSVKKRAQFFMVSESALVIDLGDNGSEFRTILARDPGLASCVLRVEGNRIAVLSSKFDRFCKLIESWGYPGK